MRSVLFFYCLLSSVWIFAQVPSIGTFLSIYPDDQKAQLQLPSTHGFQVLMLAGDTLTSGGFMPPRADFTGYVSIANSSKNGYVTVNDESDPVGGMTVLDVTLNSGGGKELWKVNQSQALNFTSVQNTKNNSSGGIMPWGNVISCEGDNLASDNNGDGYYDFGWHIEVNPSTKTVLKKHYAMGRMKHENICIRNDQKTCYFGANDFLSGYLYKYVADTAGKLDNGKLYALKLTGSISTATMGTWVQVPNTTITERNGTSGYAQSLSATNFDGIADVELSNEGNVVFASKGSGRIYKFTDNGNTVSFGIFVENMPYPIDYGISIQSTLWGYGNDNLAFDGEGNLWVCQDGGKKYLWVVASNHTISNPKVKLFAIMPSGGTATGITFTPDYRFLFMSVQHPDNNIANQSDEAGKTVQFNKATTLVIARKEAFSTASSIQSVSTNLQSVQLYPNPVQEDLSLSLSTLSSEDLEIKIVNLQGMVLYTNTLVGVKNLQMNLPTQSFAQGTYCVVITGKRTHYQSLFHKF